MCSNKRKIVLVGTGMVGMSFAYSALNRGLCDILVLVDLDKKRALGEAMDLNHGLAFAGSSMKIYAGDYSDCADADMVVISAGVSQKPGESRLECSGQLSGRWCARASGACSWWPPTRWTS